MTSLLDEIEKYDIPFDFIVGTNGGLAMDNTKKILYNSKVDKDIAVGILEFYETVKPLTMVMHDGMRISRKIFNSDYNLEVSQPHTDFSVLLDTHVSGFLSQYHNNQEAYEVGQRLLDCFRSSCSSKWSIRRHYSVV